MAVELLTGTDATVAKSEADSSATVSAAYDSGSTGANRRLVVVVSYEDGGNVNTSLRKRVSGVTYNGSALTAAVQKFHVANNATSESIEIWTLDAPATGSNTLAVSFSNNTEDSTYIIAAAVYTGVSSVGATASAEAVDGASDTVTDLALTFTDAAGYAVIALALSTAGMGPIDSVSGWTVDHEDEQGAADGGGAIVLGHYQTDAASAKTFTWSPGASTVSTRRWTGAAIELIPAAAGITVTVDDDTPTPTQAIVITKSGGDFAGTVSVFLDDNTGTPVDVSAAVTGSGATRTLLLGAGSIANYDDSNATWEKIRWGQPITLTVTDDDGTGTDIITITYAPDDHFDTLGASGVYVTSPAGSGDDSFVHIVSGDGEGLPILADLQGSTVPTVARFGQFDVSANKWLAQIEHTFDVASVTLDGEYADAFTGVDGTLITAHTPDADVVGDGYTIEKDVSTAPAVSNAVDIQSNTVRINDANEGLVIDVGDTTPDFSFDWKLESGASGRQFVAQVRRLDDTEHIHVYVQQTGLIRVNERVASANIGVTGTNETTYSGGFLENTTYRFRVHVDGLQVSVYVDDVLQVQVQSTRAADAHATKVGLFAAGAGTFPVYFDNANAYSDYSAAALTLTASDESPVPGDVITLAVGNGVLANTSYTGTLNGVAATLGSKTTGGCTLTIPAIDEFDAAGTMINTLFNRNIVVELDDGVTTVSTTIQIAPPVPGNFGTVGAGALIYPPAGTQFGFDGYVEVVTGDGSADPESMDFSASTLSTVRFRAADTVNEIWLAYREESFAAASTGVVRSPLRGVVRSIIYSVVE